MRRCNAAQDVGGSLRRGFDPDPETVLSPADAGAGRRWTNASLRMIGRAVAKKKANPSGVAFSEERGWAATDFSSGRSPAYAGRG